MWASFDTAITRNPLIHQAGTGTYRDTAASTDKQYFSLSEKKKSTQATEHLHKAAHTPVYYSYILFLKTHSSHL